MPLFANLRKLLALALLLCSATLHAADHAETEQVKVRLIAERNLALPGSDVLIGLEQRIIPHWHTYWQNPGDSGMPTSIAWTLPAGASAGPIQWPVPTRQKQGALTNFGYAGSALLLTSIHIPANAKAGNEFPVTAKASWLVCEEICIPQQAELTLTLKIVAPGTRLPAANPAISAARTALPKEAPWAASTVRGKDTLQLRIASPELAAQKFEEIWFYPLKWGKLDHGAPQSVSRDGDALLLTLHYGEAPPTADESLEGLLVVSEKSADGVLAHGFNLRAAPASTAPAAATSEGATD
ncbi:MAG TPA: protein-disulfide reductase DsbD domain-containing protein, partial [Rhodocyclaceae bacterium]